MIKWNCNFNIEDSTIQVGLAFVIIEDFENRASNCKVNIKITDNTQEIIIKQYSKIVNGIFNEDDELYPILLEEFKDAEII